MLSWANAEEFCEADGGGLISLNTRMKNSFIANVLVGKYGYISEGWFSRITVLKKIERLCEIT